MSGTLPRTRLATESFYKNLNTLAHIPAEMLGEKETVYYATVNGVRRCGPFGSKSEATLASTKLREEWLAANDGNEEIETPVFGTASDEDYVVRLVLREE